MRRSRSFADHDDGNGIKIRKNKNERPILYPETIIPLNKELGGNKPSRDPAQRFCPILKKGISGKKMIAEK